MNVLIALGICVGIAAVIVGGIWVLSWLEWKEYLDKEERENRK